VPLLSFAGMPPPFAGTQQVSSPGVRIPPL
jgi:hypothetical protein